MQRAAVAVRCAGRQPWECHRWYLADALVVTGARVVHLIEVGRHEFHRRDPLARPEDGLLVYDRSTTDDLALS